jgi:ABC-type phosphate transport system permease subunit
MRLNITALSIASGLLWGAAMLIVASAHSIWPSYGGAFLEVASSIYSGYDPGPGIGSIIIGTLYGVVDGAIAGAIFGLLYNFVSWKFPSAAA